MFAHQFLGAKDAEFLYLGMNETPGHSKAAVTSFEIKGLVLFPVDQEVATACYSV